MSRKRDGARNFFPMPQKIFNQGMNAGEIAVYAYLMFRENRKTYHCYPSYRSIGDAMGMSRNTVKKYVDALVEKQQHTDQSGFQPYQPKHRKPGTGCVYQINDHLWEGKYSPVGPDGKRIRRNVYAPTKEECEKKLAVMIEEMKKEIKGQKQMKV